jgi:hypothetical protein
MKRMSKWVHKYNVEFESVYAKLPTSILSEYLLEVSWKDEGKLTEYHTIKVQDSRFISELNHLWGGDRERCYFAHGMQDIDFYRTKDGEFAITHSPFSGLNIQMVFKDGEFEKLIGSLKEPVFK